MTLLVTGADGFTGVHFVAHAAAQGRAVIPLRADLTDAEAVKREVESVSPTHVLHLAAISFVGHANAKAFYDVNLFGTLNLLEALKGLARRPERIVLASSANVYGDTRTSPISERQMPAPVNHYAMSKLSMELMALTYAASLPLIIARPFNYTGRGQNPSFIIPKLVDHFVRRAPRIELGNLDVEREFNDIRFVCEAYGRLLENGRTGEIYNICSGVPHALRSVIERLVSMTGHRPEVVVNPAFVRANEVVTLFGDPAKLHEHLGALASPDLGETLEWMLTACG